MKRIPLSLFGIDSDKAFQVVKKLNSKTVYLMADGKEWYILLDDELADVLKFNPECFKKIENKITQLEAKLSDIEKKLTNVSVTVASTPIVDKSEPQQETAQATQEVTQDVKQETEKEDTLTVYFIDEPHRPYTEFSELEKIEMEEKQFFCKKCNRIYTVKVPKDKKIDLVLCGKGHVIYKRKRFGKKHVVAVSVLSVVAVILTYLTLTGTIIFGV